jgi:hypothetical protein
MTIKNRRSHQVKSSRRGGSYRKKHFWVFSCLLAVPFIIYYSKFNEGKKDHYFSNRCSAMPNDKNYY